MSIFSTKRVQTKKLEINEKVFIHKFQSLSESQKKVYKKNFLIKINKS